MSSHYGWKSERGTHCLSHPMESSSHGINPQGLPCPWVLRWLGRRMMWSGSYARESLQRPLQNLKSGRAAGMVCPPPPLQAAAIPEMALGRPVPNPPTPGPSDGVRSSEGSGRHGSWTQRDEWDFSRWDGGGLWARRSRGSKWGGRTPRTGWGTTSCPVGLHWAPGTR